jgi:hypothetical protein
MNQENCPICGFPYGEGSNMPRRKSRHHIFPKKWFRGSTTIVYVCQKCHDEFHQMFPYGQKKWTKKECVLFWILFCEEKDFDYTKEYRSILNTKGL